MTSPAVSPRHKTNPKARTPNDGSVPPIVRRCAIVGMLAALAAGGCSKTPSDKPAPTPKKEQAPVPKNVEDRAPPSETLTGSIQGTVAFKGQVPGPTKIDMSTKPECAEANPTAVRHAVQTEDGGLAEVFVYVKEGLPKDKKYPSPSTPVKLDQEGCLYKPRVLGIQTGQTLTLVNSDPFMHNVNAQAKRGSFNVAMVKPGTATKKFKKPEVMVPIECNVHPWMKAWIGVMAHPFFATTSPKGTFKIENIPAGDVVLEFWHPTLGTRSKKITVAGEKMQTVQVEFETSS